MKSRSAFNRLEKAFLGFIAVVILCSLGLFVWTSYSLGDFNQCVQEQKSANRAISDC